MADATASGADLFDGLGLDYNFLGGRDPTQADPLATGSANDTLFDHEVPGAASAAAGAGDQDMMMPQALNFAFPSAVPDLPQRYRMAPQHRHKRVKSNPDVLQQFSMGPPPAASRLTAGGRPMPPDLVSAVFHSIANDFQDPMGDVQAANPKPIGIVHVTTPKGLEDPMMPMPIPYAAAPGSDETIQDMDEFLNTLSWSDASANALPAAPVQMQDPSMMGPFGMQMQHTDQFAAMDVAGSDIKMKRKRPTSGHVRHHSSPVDLLQNLDQFRLMAQQTTQPDPYQFQLPPTQMGNVSASRRALLDRRASLQSSSFAAGGSGAMTAARVSRRPTRSTGLSMDLSQINLDFLSVPEEEFPPRASPPQHISPPHRSGSVRKVATSSTSTATDQSDVNRKLYKCGRCGQPKVGHVCTMPDQRNNWTQVDLEVTKGIKIMRINCHILPVRSKWVAQHEDNVEQADAF